MSQELLHLAKLSRTESANTIVYLAVRYSTSFANRIGPDRRLAFPG